MRRLHDALRMTTSSIDRGADAPQRAVDAGFQRTLSRFNAARLQPTLPDATTRSNAAAELELRVREDRFVESERAAIADWAAEAPHDATGFLAWFVALEQAGPGQGDPLFPYLRDEASYDELRWFVGQEVSGEAGFDDLVALTQVKMPVRAKLELARNYWDELGRGAESGLHGPMLARLARALGVDGTVEPIPEALALANLLVALAANRRWAYHSIGALGVIELTAPARATCVNLGLKRVGLGARERQYYALHATLDVQHSTTWNREVIAPLVEEDPSRACAIAEGALMRLTAGARCFERYRGELGVKPSD